MKAILGTLLAGSVAWGAESAHFGIRVVDEGTGRGVPMVEVSTVNHIRHWTDSQGWVAFLEPGLMGREVWFHVRSPGYERKKDGFGYAGFRATPGAGAEAVVQIRRLNVAERLYRITGQGIDRDSVLLGRSTPRLEPALNGGVLGQDTVIATPYRGRIHWFWGDTDRASYPLGNFGASGATSAMPGPGGLDPEVAIHLTYFGDDHGFVRPMCPEPKEGLRWIEGVMTVPDEKGRERLVARVAHHKDLGPALGWYLMVWDDDRSEFRQVRRWDRSEGHDSSHPFRVRAGGVEYLYLYPNWRVPADLASLGDEARYEAFTCVGGDGRVRGGSTSVVRDGNGRAVYSWRSGADRLSAGRLRELVKAGVLEAGDAWLDLHDVETGNRVVGSRGSVAWNAFRKRWILLIAGKAGEVWYAEGDTPTGPWVYARRVVEHGEFNFYNPVHHAFLDADGGRRIFFEGTYTATFAAAREKTPRYEYNQLMYALSLDDPRIALPVPVYRVEEPDGTVRLGTWDEVTAWGARSRVSRVEFFAFPAATRASREAESGAFGATDGTRVEPGWGRVWSNPQRTLAWDPQAEPVR